MSKTCNICGKSLSKYQPNIICGKCKAKETATKRICPSCGKYKLASTTLCKTCHTHNVKYNKSTSVLCPLCNQEKPREAFLTMRRKDKGAYRYNTAITKGCYDCRHVNDPRMCTSCGKSKRPNKFDGDSTVCISCVTLKTKRLQAIIPLVHKRIKHATRIQSAQEKELLFSRGIIICSRCNTQKPLCDFNTYTKSVNGYQNYCKECISEYLTVWKKTDIGKYRRNVWKQTDKAKDLRWKNKRKRRALNRGSFSKSQFNHVLDVYSHTCLLCGTTDDICADHVLALATGGMNTIDNIQPLCRLCNTLKSTEHTDMRLFWFLYVKWKM